MSKYIVCLFGAFLSLTCHTSRGVMLRGSGEALQRPSVINSESQFDVEKSLVQLKGDTEKLSSNNKKSFLHKNEEQEESYIELSKEQEKRLEDALVILLELDAPGTIGMPRDWREALQELAETGDSNTKKKAKDSVLKFKAFDPDTVREMARGKGRLTKKAVTDLLDLKNDIQKIVEQKTMLQRRMEEQLRLFEETAGKVKYDDKKKGKRFSIGAEHQKKNSL